MIRIIVQDEAYLEQLFVALKLQFCCWHAGPVDFVNRSISKSAPLPKQAYLIARKILLIL